MSSKPLKPIVKESKFLEQKISTLFKASSNLEADVAEIANDGDYDLLLIGIGQSIYDGTFLGKILG